MATDVETLLVKLEARITDFEKKMARAKAVADQSTRAIETRFNQMNGFLKGSLGGFAKAFIAAFSVGAVASGVRRAVADLGDLADAAERAGVSAEKLQVLRYALDQGTGSAEEADDALSKFNVTLGKSLTAIQSNSDPFARLGVSLRDASGRARQAEAVFDDVAKRLSTLSSPAERAALAAELFGKKSGPDLAALLAPGSASLEEIRKRMQALGNLWTNETVKAGDDLDTKFKEWGDVLDKFYKKAVISTADAVWYLYDATQAVGDQTNLAHLGDELESLNKARDKLNDQIIEIQQSNPAGAIIGPGKALLERQLADLKAQIQELDHQSSAVLNRIGEIRAAEKASHPFRQTTSDDLPPPVRTLPSVRSDAARITDQAAEAMRRYDERMRDITDDAKTFGSTFLEAMRSGKSAADALREAVGRLADRFADQLLDKGISALVGSFLGGGRSGLSLATAGGAGALFGGFRAAGGDVLPGKAYVVGEKRPEIFVPNMPGTIVPRVGGAGPNFTFAPVIDARGADVAAVARLEQSMATMQKNFKDNVIQAVRSGQSSRELR